MKKIDIDFCISDDSVNVYGYRLLTSGFDASKFNPPVGFLMHDREKGVAVRWEDIRCEEGKIFARPVVNDELFPTLAEQIEGGFYNAASVGHIVALEIDESDASKLEGQTGPTVTKWFCRECSIVDIPGNYNAIARLYDESDNLLHDLSANLIPDADLAAQNAHIKSLTERAELAELKAEKAERAYADLRSTVAADKINAMVATAINDRRITPALAEQLKADYADNPEKLSALLDKMQTHPLLTERIEANKGVPPHLQGRSLRDLYISGELEAVKRDYPEYYNHLMHNA